MLMATTMRPMVLEDLEQLQDGDALPSNPWPRRRDADDGVLHPWWIALQVAGGRECWASRWFMRRKIVSYVPVVATKTPLRGKKHHRLYFHPITPGLIFVPAEFTSLARRTEIEGYAHVYGYLKTGGEISRISKGDIEIIRDIEAKLSMPPPPAKRVKVPTVGDRVRFRNSLYAKSLGRGIVFQVASNARIGVEVERLVGRAGRIFVPAHEIEVM